MQNGSEYANPMLLQDWNQIDWTLWFGSNSLVLEKLGVYEQAMCSYKKIVSNS